MAPEISVMAGLDPAIQGRRGVPVLTLADARLLDGRLKGGHDGTGRATGAVG